METFYKAYTKISENKLYYFVKKYLSFPEYKDVADILEGYGMHTDFKKACSIAGVSEPEIRERLLEEIQNAAPTAKVIDLNPSEEILMTKKVAQ